ncbi:MAG: efflux RND transporter periplasmic adaptor subunit [Candidatus Cloacimonetes bacterium]|nr:efflux RND transporter periplasmic adaptor subunit [Candidatus Cloacimonadota bacterium]MCF7813594.1 efflux RND transporter periplasmic adaptor subunit [Candidatus Cloacimonadota bacterium]MCF7867910.1 efflux RND transporter periplasmic adaptor subunit [Candidatus Cloacimonadota bacterium]MCF7882897.1 efflux RND transporter periplasmic adaptor subunit [Candidatus Cloacimonadota bacterium]
MIRIKWIIAFSLIVLFLASCGKPAGNGQFNREVKENAIIVMVQDMQPRDLDKYIRITGKLEGFTDVNLLSESNGKVIEIFKNLGDWVNKGDAIGRLDNSDVKNQLKQAEAQLLSAEASLESATINFNVSKNLYDKEMISESEFLQSKSSLKSAQANYNGLKASVEMARKSLENSEFTSPVSGYIAELNLEIGEMVSMGMQIAGIVNSKQLILKTGISEADIPYVKKGDTVTILYSGNKYNGKVTGVGIRPKTEGNNYPIEVLLSNTDKKLFPGMVVEGRIFSSTFENVLYTSIENLREKYDQQFVYVINADNRAEHKIVEIGEKVSNNVIITSGLEVGDKLVIDGIDSLTENALVEVRSGFSN